MILTMKEVFLSQPGAVNEGFINLKKENIKPISRKILETLLDYNYKSQGLKLSQDRLERHHGHMIQLRIRQMSWLLQGVVDWTPEDPLIEYETEVCFATEKDHFIESKFLRVCPCNDECQWRMTTLLIFGLVHDVVKRTRRDLGVPITLESIFSKKNVYKFLSTYTELTGPGQFRVKSIVPRKLDLPNIKADIDLSIHVFEDGIVTKDECLEPVKSHCIIPNSVVDTAEEPETATAGPTAPPAVPVPPPPAPISPPTPTPTVEELSRVRENETFGDMLERLLQTMFN